MSLLEIDVRPGPVRSPAAADDSVIALTPAMLGLARRPEFMVPAAPAARTAAPSLWDVLRLSWSEPQTKRDLLSG
jgi:hypothetical protein